MTPAENNHVGGVRAASMINVLAGIWFFVSPWVYGAYGVGNAWNSWIVGAALIVFAAIQYNNALGSRFLSWVNCLFGIWVFCSPWIYGYTMNTGRFVNSLCVGVIVFLASLRAVAGAGRVTHVEPTPHRM
jgi:SPW repeat